MKKGRIVSSTTNFLVIFTANREPWKIGLSLIINCIYNLKWLTRNLVERYNASPPLWKPYIIIKHPWSTEIRPDNERIQWRS